MPDHKQLTTTIIAWALVMSVGSAWADEKSPPVVLEEPTGAITLRHAVGLALLKNPELAVFAWELRAREAAKLQAGLLPNPRLELDLQDFGGMKDYRYARQTQSTLQLTQLIELGGKRAARVKIAERSRELVNWDYETRRVDVFTRTAEAFIDVLAGQERLTQAQELARLAERSRSVAADRVQAGKVAPIEEVKANVVSSTARIEQQRAENELATARKMLSALWAGGEPKFSIAEGELHTIYPIPPIEPLKERLEKNPDLARWAAEISFRQAAVELETAKSIPDVTLSGGYRHFEASKDETVVFNLSVPLQFFNRNQGAIREARNLQLKAEAEQRVIRLRLQTDLEQTHGRLKTTNAEVVGLQTTVLPGAQQAFDAINEGYRLGKFGYLDVMDSQRILFDAKIRFIDALTRYHKSVIRLSRLTGETSPEPGKIENREGTIRLREDTP
jgi:cobalt-zinc-cadmium efflux system outer membrane protein